MNASEQPRNLHGTLEAMLDELGRVAKNETTTITEVYEQSVDILRLLFQPDAVAVFLLGVEGLVVNATPAPDSALSEQEITRFETSEQSHGKAAVFKDESNRTSIFCELGSSSERKGFLYLKTRPDGYLALQKKVVESVGSILNQRLMGQKAGPSAEVFTRFQKFSSSCMSSLVHDDLAEMLTNDIRLVLGAERIQYFERSAQRCRLKNVSSVSRVEKRTSLLQSSEKLANEVFQIGRTVLSYNVPSSKELRTAMGEYSNLSGFPFIACVPLYGNQGEETDNGCAQPEGVLLAEYSTPPDIATFIESLNIAVPQMGMALEIAATFSSIPLHRTWLNIRRTVNARWLRKSSFAIAILAGLLIFVFAWQVDFKVRMQGSLHAVNERNVFSPRDAFVEQMLVDHGDRVNKGQLLLELSSPELQQILDEADGEIAKLKDLRNSKNVVLNQSSTGKKADRHESIRLAGEIAELDFKIQAQQDARDFALKEMHKLKVVAPIDGTIITWDAKRLLHEKPVRWGETLLKVADEKQQWQLQFLAPEKSMGYVLEAANKNEQGINGLNVEYFFSSRPNQQFKVNIADAGNATERDVSDTLGVRIICDVSPEQNLQRHGAEVTGDIHCGKRSIAFVWTHELVDAVRRHLVW